MKNQFYIMAAALAPAGIFSACQSEALTGDSPPSPPSTPSANEQTKLKATVQDLSLEDAGIVAQIFSTKNAGSRSDARRNIQNIVTIPDDNGNPAIYAANFDDGFILISATKKYYPILAAVDHGTFSLETMNDTGMGIVINEMIENIAIAKSGEHDFQARPLWNEFSEKKVSPAQVRSRATDDYWVAYENWWLKECQGDCNVYYLHECRDEILPPDVYERYVRAAQDEDLWEGTEYDWWWTAYVVERMVSNVDRKGPFLTTTWDQVGSYNTSGYDALGCVTVAVGQLMKYYQHPKTFAWDKMPDNYASPELTSFLTKKLSKLI